MSDKPWLDKEGRATNDPKERAREFIRRLEVLSGVPVPISCPVCGHRLEWDVSKSLGLKIHATFATIQNQMQWSQMPVLLIRCQRCPFIFTFDVGRDGFGEMPERVRAGEERVRAGEEGDVIDVERLKGMALCKNQDASDAVQLLHLMFRAGAWSAHERPENFPLWRPEDAVYHFDQFFCKHVDAERIETAFLELQKGGLVKRTDGGYVLVEET